MDGAILQAATADKLVERNHRGIWEPRVTITGFRNEGEPVKETTPEDRRRQDPYRLVGVHEAGIDLSADDYPHRDLLFRTVPEQSRWGHKNLNTDRFRHKEDDFGELVPPPPVPLSGDLQIERVVGQGRIIRHRSNGSGVDVTYPTGTVTTYYPDCTLHRVSPWDASLVTIIEQYVEESAPDTYRKYLEKRPEWGELTHYGIQEGWHERRHDTSVIEASISAALAARGLPSDVDTAIYAWRLMCRTCYADDIPPPRRRVIARSFVLLYPPVAGETQQRYGIIGDTDKPDDLGEWSTLGKDAGSVLRQHRAALEKWAGQKLTRVIHRGRVEENTALNVDAKTFLRGALTREAMKANESERRPHLTPRRVTKNINDAIWNAKKTQKKIT